MKQRSRGKLGLGARTAAEMGALASILMAKPQG
jgi:hypothetical protein